MKDRKIFTKRHLESTKDKTIKGSVIAKKWREVTPSVNFGPLDSLKSLELSKMVKILIFSVKTILNMFKASLFKKS